MSLDDVITEEVHWMDIPEFNEHSTETFSAELPADLILENTYEPQFRVD